MEGWSRNFVGDGERAAGLHDAGHLPEHSDWVLSLVEDHVANAASPVGGSSVALSSYSGRYRGACPIPIRRSRYIIAV
jgi:hypothetical protein